MTEEQFIDIRDWRKEGERFMVDLPKSQGNRVKADIQTPIIGKNSYWFGVEQASTGVRVITDVPVDCWLEVYKDEAQT